MAAQKRKERTSNYHSPLRAAQAARTRLTILESALALFSTQGWRATTLPAIAERAGVAVDTVYAVFGTKSNLLMAVVEVALVGDDEEAPMAARDDFARMGAGARPERVRAGVRYTMDVYERSVPILRALGEAAASDRTARERLSRYDTDRRELIATGMALILDGEASDEVVDTAWALVSPEVYGHLKEGRGWSDQAVEDWFVDLVTAGIARADG